MSKFKPDLCFVGHMVGRNPGHTTTQGQIVADLFSRGGYTVHSVSSKLNRVSRMIDVIATILQRRRTTDLLIIDVFSGLSFLMADAATLLAKYLNVPIVAVLRGGNLPAFTERFPRWTFRVLRRFDEMVAPSAFLAEEVARQGLEARVIPNIIDLEIYPYRVRQAIRPSLLWMRAFHPIYNPEMALRVFALVRRDHPTATMVMAGVDKGLQDGVKTLAKEMELDDAIRFPGFLDPVAKIKEFSGADIYLNTNKIDNMPVSVLEACAMGLPVVATNVGGLPHLITDGVNGLLVPDGDAEAMANAVNRVLNDPDLAGRLSANGRALAERSSWTSVRRSWDELFAQLLARGRRRKEIVPELLETSSG